MVRTVIKSDELPAAVGPFSPAVEAGGLIYVSGQIAQSGSGRLVDGHAAAQTEQIFRNLVALLHAAGKTLDDVVRVGLYLTNMDDYQAVNDVYTRHFQPPYPARTTIAVAGLPLGAGVELETIVR